jgi:acetyl/propionyl-CoA carboxylase alpha subunit
VRADLHDPEGTTLPVSTLLIANRAEIAVRIIATAAAMGIRTVAVYPDDDADCAHVARADTAVRIEGTGPSAYLGGEQLVRVALESGCDAVHPGYGFLSENAEFATRCGEAGLAFVGPSPGVIALLGDKSRAREQARQLGIPLLPGTSGSTDLAGRAQVLRLPGSRRRRHGQGTGGRRRPRPAASDPGRRS